MPDREASEREAAIGVEQRGVHDCLRACVATVLGLPYEQVPEFLRIDETEDQNVPWRRRLYDFLGGRGLVPWEFGLHGDERPLLMFGGTPIAYNVMPPGLWIAAVQSPRIEGTHAVVMRGGQVMWDPHPQRDMGHKGFREAMIFLPAYEQAHTVEREVWTCMSCGHISEGQSCAACGAECMPGRWVRAALTPDGGSEGLRETPQEQWARESNEQQAMFELHAES